MERRENHIELADKISDIQIEIAKGFTRINEQHISYQSVLKELRDDQEKLLHIIYGNGKEGILTIIAKMGQKLNFMWIIISTLSLATLTLTTGIVQDFVSKVLH
jgi:hypothetical protein